MSKSGWFICFCFVLLSSPTLNAGQVWEGEVLLRNALDVERDEIVVIDLKRLNVPGEAVNRAKGVEVRVAGGRKIESQLDQFGSGFSTEVAFEISMKANEWKVVKIRLLDSARQAKAETLSARRIDRQSVVVKTSTFSIQVRNDMRGFYALQPAFPIAKKEAEEESFEDLDDVDDEPAETEQIDVDGPKVEAPFSGDGIPFALAGIPRFSKGARLQISSGPIRIVVSLLDPGPWRVAKMVADCELRQSFWFPRIGGRFFFEAEANLKTQIPRAQLKFAGLRVDSVNQSWKLTMGQRGRPPQMAPVPITLRGDRIFYLEGYQRSTFNHEWARAESKAGWVTLFIDRAGSSFSKNVGWNSGRRKLGVRLDLSDNGVYTSSVQPTLRFKGLEPASGKRLRAMCRFGDGKEQESGIRNQESASEAERLQSGMVVYPVKGHLSSALDVSLVFEKIKKRAVVLIGADATPSAIEKDLMAHIGAVFVRQDAFLRYLNLMAKADPNAPLAIVTGMPGCHGLFDQLNADLKVVNPYPQNQNRSVIRFESSKDGVPLLFPVGNTRPAAEEALQKLKSVLPESGPLPALIVTQQSWADRMPFPWSGLRELKESVQPVFRNSQVDCLYLVRATRDITGLKASAPEGWTIRSVRWNFRDQRSTQDRVVPVHDAAFPGHPDSLKQGEMLTLWLSREISKEAEQGEFNERMQISCDADFMKQIALKYRVLAPILPDRQSFGFYPMGARKDGIKLYFGWNDEQYYQHLPAILKDLAPFMVNAFMLETNAIKIDVDPEGEASVDAGEFEKELNAVRSSGVIDMLMASGPVFHREMRAIAVRRKLEDPIKSWEFVVPGMRKELERLGVADRIVCRYADEISDYDKWLAKARQFKKAGFVMTVAINGYGVQHRREGIGTMGLWMPLYNFFLNRWGRPISILDTYPMDAGFRDERLKAGEHFWPYVCGPGPYAWSSRPRSQGRFLIIDTYLKGAQGLSYYGGMYFSHGVDPKYRKTHRADLLNEDHTFTCLFYPDVERNTVAPSIRAGAMRSGFQDVAAIRAVLEAAGDRRAEADSRIRRAFRTIQLNASQSEFDSFRQSVARVYEDFAAR